nr:Hpt domain-containing protein [Oculatellaceae cyanobacterium Prado106]
MLSEQQQRIMGYFIEEAKDHLNTIEQGLLNLQGTIEDPEMVNEVFRAAHSVKGGAAMLGLTSIQHTSHRLEDYFKILKECPIKIDHALETLFLRVYDTLQELLEHLQGPFGLTDEKAAEAMAGVEPVFQELNRIFGSLVAQSGGALPEDVELPFVTSAIPSTHSAHRTTQQPATVSAEESAVQLLFQSDVPARLREMLQVFKQEDNANSRQQLQGICTILAQYGEPLDLIQWRQLVLDAQRAIASPNNTYRTLAPVIIKEIKQAQELVISGNPTQISASENLKALLPAPVEPAATFDTNADFLDLFGTIDEADSSAELSFADFDNLTLNAEPATPASATAAASPMPATELPLPQTDSGAGDDDWFSNALSTAAAPQEISPLEQPSAPSASSAVPFAASLEAQSVPSTTLPSLNFMDSLDDSEVSDRRSGPEVGIAELNSLADLFEGDMPDLGLTWQEENVISDINEVSLSASGSPELDTFSDLLLDSEHSEDLLLDSSDEDLSGLLDNSGLQQGRSASTSQPFENEFLDGLEPFDINSDGISGELSQSASESFLDLDALPDLEAPSAGPEGMGSSSDDFFLDTPGLGDDANASDLGGLDDLFGESAETEMGAIADPFASELDGLGDIFAEDTGVVEVAAIDPSSEAIQEADAFSDSFLGLSVEPSSAEPDLLQS